MINLLARVDVEARQSIKDGVAVFLPALAKSIRSSAKKKMRYFFVPQI